MVVAPVLTLVTTPDEEPTVATPTLLLVHVPPDAVFVRVDVAPIVHTPNMPEMADIALTVIGLIAEHPLDVVYRIFNEPPVTPVTIPVADPTVAKEVLLLLQTPPDVAFVSAVVSAGQTVDAPLIAAGDAFTVTFATALQLLNV